MLHTADQWRTNEIKEKMPCWFREHLKPNFLKSSFACSGVVPSDWLFQCFLMNIHFYRIFHFIFFPSLNTYVIVIGSQGTARYHQTLPVLQPRSQLTLPSQFRIYTLQQRLLAYLGFKGHEDLSVLQSGWFDGKTQIFLKGEEHPTTPLSFHFHNKTDDRYFTCAYELGYIAYFQSAKSLMQDKVTGGCSGLVRS